MERRRDTLAPPIAVGLPIPSRADWVGLAVTAVLLGTHELLSRHGLALPTPTPLLLVAVVLSARYGGMRAGFYSVGLSLAYALVRLSAPGRLFSYGEAQALQLLLLGIGAPALAYAVGQLRSRGAPFGRLDVANAELGRQRAELAAQRAELEAQRAELAAEKRQRLTALQRLGLAVGTRADPDALLALVAETVQELACARGAAVLLPGAGGDLEVVAAHGIAARGMGRWPTPETEAFLRSGGERAARILAAGAALAAFRDLVAEHGVETLMVARVPAPDEGLAGALVVLDPRADAAEAAEALEAAAAQAGAALARLRLERQSARRARRARLLAAAIDQLQLAVAIAGPDGRIRYANAAAARLHGAERRALRGLRLDSLFPSAPFAVLDAGAESGTGEVLHQRPDGTAIPVRVTVASLRARSGGRLATVLIARDVSDEKRQQAQLMESDRLAMVGGLVSAVAHELNNPLAAIGNFAELLRADEEDRERREMLDTIAHEATRAGRTVRNLLSFSRPSSAARDWVRLSEVVDRTVALRIYDQRRRRIEIGIDIPPDLPPVWADANQLQQVLLNLIVNAEQAIGTDGRIQVRACVGDAGTVMLAVEDTGPGIGADVLPQIFTPFVTTKEEHVGTGLGLSISRDIVQAHGGRITAENRPEGGARFVVALPATAGAPQPAAPHAR